MLKHLGIIMDGNRRWAKQRGLPSFMGHRQGAETLTKIARACYDRGIEELSLYALSIENLKRSVEEKRYMFDLLIEFARTHLESFIQQDVQVRFCGDRNLFPDVIKPAVYELEQKTAACKSRKLNILLCYGGQQEIVAAVRTIADDVQAGRINLEHITKDFFAQRLWVTGIEPEMIIRTGNALRLSNFLSFQSAYSELFFTECFWPDFTVELLDKMLGDFELRKRNFGT